MTLEEKLNLIVNDLKCYCPEKIILFGSAVRGDTDRHSDLDIVVIKNTKKRFLERLIEVSKLYGMTYFLWMSLFILQRNLNLCRKKKIHSLNRC